MWQASEITTPGGSIVKESIAIILVLLLKDGWIGNWKIKRLLYLLWLLILRPNISKIIIFPRIFRMSAVIVIPSELLPVACLICLIQYMLYWLLPFPLCHTRMEDTLLYTFELLYAMHWIGYQLAVTQLEHWICGRAAAKLTRRRRTFPVDERKVSKEFNTD